MTAEQIAKALGARRIGHGWRGPCPIHGGSSFTLEEKEGKILFHCWAGCDRKELLAQLRRLGLWPERERRDFTLQERQAYARARREAAAMVEWRDELVRTLEDLRDVYFESYQGSMRWVLRWGLDAPGADTYHDVHLSAEQKYQELDVMLDKLRRPRWALLLKVYRRYKTRTAA